MTDSELIAILTRKLPEELTLEETELLLRRLSASPELRRKLLEEIPLEAYVAEAIGRSRQQAPARRLPAGSRKSSTAATMALGVLVVMPLVALVAVVAVSLWWPGGEDRPVTGESVAKPKAPIAAEWKPAEPSKPKAREQFDKSANDVAKSSAAKQIRPAPQPEGPAAAPPPPPPWQAALDHEGDPPPYTDIAFASFEQSFDVANKDDLT